MPRRYRANASILVICLRSWDSDPESWDAIGFGMLWASPSPNLAYEDEEMGVFLSEEDDLPDGGGEGEVGRAG